MIDDKMKVYSAESTFDAKGNVIRKTYFDADRKPCLDASGVAGYNACFDADGREVSRRFFDLNGKPIAAAGRAFGWDKTYDVYGNETARIELDAKGAVIPDPDANGAAYHTKVFDSRGRQIGWLNCDADRRPTIDRDGHAGGRFSYDRQGRIVRTDFTGPDGKPHASASTHVASRRNEYSADGSRVTVWWLGEDGKVTQHADGNAGFIDHFDSQQRRTQREFINAQGQNTTLKDGCAREVWVYGSTGEVVMH